MAEFTKKVHMRVVNEFEPKSDVAEIVGFVKAQRLPGELIISLPGNGGIAAITFKEKEEVRPVKKIPS